jgi:hypothetical protein
MVHIAETPQANGWKIPQTLFLSLSKRFARSVDSFKKFRKGNSQCLGQSPNSSQSCLSGTTLKIRYMHLVNAGVLGEINLPPTFGFPQAANSCAQQDTNISCHLAIVGLVFKLNLVHALSSKTDMTETDWLIAVVILVGFVLARLLRQISKCLDEIKTAIEVDLQRVCDKVDILELSLDGRLETIQKYFIPSSVIGESRFEYLLQNLRGNVSSEPK